MNRTAVVEPGHDPNIKLVDPVRSLAVSPCRQFAVYNGKFRRYDPAHDRTRSLAPFSRAIFSRSRSPGWKTGGDWTMPLSNVSKRACSRPFAGFPLPRTKRASDRGRPDMACPGCSRLEGQPPPAEPDAAGPRGLSDGLLFADDEGKDRANRLAEEWRRYGFGLAVVESKRWLRPLDRRSGRRARKPRPRPRCFAIFAGRGSDDRQPAVGDSYQRRAVAALLSGAARCRSSSSRSTWRPSSTFGP
jgi:hypothetical protein